MGIHVRWFGVVLLTGCMGSIGSAGEPGGPTLGADDPPPDDYERPLVPVECESEDATLPFQDMRRLTKHEYTNALRSLFSSHVYRHFASLTGLIPEDRIDSHFDSLAQGVSSSHVRGYATVAEAIGSHLYRSADARMRTIRCLEGATDGTCMHEFIRTFGAQVFRRPLTEQEFNDYVELDALGQEDSREMGLRLVLSAMLQAPQFLFRVELGSEQVAGTVDQVRLTDFEIAAKLAFTLWGEAPDQELRDAAAAGMLVTDAGLEMQFERMLADEKAQLHLARFFEQWLDLDRLPNLDLVSEGRRRGRGLNDFHNAAVEEIRALTKYIVWEQQGSFRDLMTTRESFLNTGSIAAVYEAEDWECCGISQVTLDERRAGILSRVALLGNEDGIQHPVIRGHRIREQFLCGELSLPDPEDLGGLEIVDPEPDPTATTRERFAALTEPMECAGCHSLLNPLGFALSEFDGIGRYQPNEAIFENDEIVAEVPADARVDPWIDGGPSGFEVRGPAELGAALAEHPVAVDCMAEQWLEYNLARPRERTDACAVGDLATAIANEDGSYLDMMRRWVMRPEFRVRRIDRGMEGE